MNKSRLLLLCAAALLCVANLARAGEGVCTWDPALPYQQCYSYWVNYDGFGHYVYQCYCYASASSAGRCRDYCNIEESYSPGAFPGCIRSCDEDFLNTL